MVKRKKRKLGPTSLYYCEKWEHMWPCFVFAIVAPLVLCQTWPLCLVNQELHHVLTVAMASPLDSVCSVVAGSPPHVLTRPRILYLPCFAIADSTTVKTASMLSTSPAVAVLVTNRFAATLSHGRPFDCKYSFNEKLVLEQTETRFNSKRYIWSEMFSR